MKPTEWNALIREYSLVREARRDVVFPALINQLRKLDIHRLLDYGGGDGVFVAECARRLRIGELYSFDPAPEALELATTTLSQWSHAHVVNNTKDFDGPYFDAITFNAVWMCLPDWESCVKALKDVRRLLKPNGHFIAAVTHPCFRSIQFSTYAASFDMRDYLKDGQRFNVRIFDGERTITVIDTHWSLSAMSRQLKSAGFMVEELEEMADISRDGPSSTKGSPWLLVRARGIP